MTNMMSLKEPSAPRKITDTSYAWPVKGIGYATISPISVIDSSVAFALSLGTPETIYGLSRQKLHRYEKLRKMPNTYNREIVNGKKSCYDEIESHVRVKSLNAKRSDKGIYYLVTFGNLVQQDASKREKRESLDNLSVNCGCPIASYQRICRAEASKRKMFGDKRVVTDKPSPYIESPICKHAVVALNWLHFVYDTYDFGIFGLSKDFVEASRPLILKILARELNPKLPDYKLNTQLWQEKNPHLQKLNDLIWRS